MPDKSIQDFFAGKPPHTLELFNAFIEAFNSIGLIKVSAAKTMIGISNSHKRIVWVTQIGKGFIHIVFPFRQAYHDNLCFTKIAQVPGTQQFNHHFRMLHSTDLNDEVLRFMKLAYDEEVE